MKQASLLVVALALAPACGKHNEADVLQHEAMAAAKFYAPKLDALDARVQAIFQRGSTIPATTPGIEAVGTRLTEARDMIVQLRQIVGPGTDKKSAVEKQAAAAAKDRKISDLEKLVHDTHSTLDRGITVINDNLQSVESWISYFDRQALAMPMPGRGSPPPPETLPPAPQAPPTAPPTTPPGAPGAGGAPRREGGGAAVPPAPAPAHP